jgi:hypothetical protein
MAEQSSAATLAGGGVGAMGPAVLVIVAVVACSSYANLSYLVTQQRNYEWFPPFKPYHNANRNWELGGENFEIAKSLVAGKGFASPFKEPTGPTAWMPPVLPGILAALLAACDGNRDAVTAVVVVLQVCVLIGTGFLVLSLARQTTGALGAWIAAAIYVLGLIYHFHACFQYTHDSWLVLLALDLLVAGLCWLRPLPDAQTAADWGVFGGLCALVNPIVGLVWGVLTLVRSGNLRARLALALLFAALIVAPWLIRNYVVFDRLIPIKSNLAYELYQSQCLQPDGLIQRNTFASHPFGSASRERQEYKALGEVAFLDKKRERFWQSVSADPLNFMKRVGDRFLGATLWHSPFDRIEEAKRPWLLWLNRALYALPFLSLLFLVITPSRRPLSWLQWCVIGVYLVYLLPYILFSYYERYAEPLVAVKALLVIWALDRLLSFRQFVLRLDASTAGPFIGGKKRYPARPAREL